MRSIFRGNIGTAAPKSPTNHIIPCGVGRTQAILTLNFGISLLPGWSWEGGGTGHTPLRDEKTRVNPAYRYEYAAFIYVNVAWSSKRQGSLVSSIHLDPRQTQKNLYFATVAPITRDLQSGLCSPKLHRLANRREGGCGVFHTPYRPA